MFKRLPPHGKLNCVMHLLTNETIDEAISRIATSEGMYKMYWILSQKSQNADQGKGHKETLAKKVRAAVDKAMHLLAMELNLKKGSMDLMVANTIVERKIRLAGKVADMSETRRRQAQMSPILAKKCKCMSGRHELVTDTRFLCRGFPTLVSTKNLRTS